MKIKDRMIVALDFSELETAQNFVEKMEDNVSFYKVGLELFLNSSGKIIEYLKSKNKKIFLDLKFYDIPNTTAMASKFCEKQDIEIFNVHASGGEKMMKEVKKVAPSSKVIGVTILTSFTEDELNNTYKSKLDLHTLTLHLAKLTKKSGLNGVVCSPHEAREIKELCGDDFITVCPGVRPSWAQSNDQARIMTPYEAILNGCDYLVVGRPITKSDDPIKASQMVLTEIEKGVKDVDKKL